MLTLAIDKDVAVRTRDGVTLRADVFRPSEPGTYPVILTHGPYGKDIHFADFNPGAYKRVDERGPHMNWETANPEWWVPRGYVCVRVDQRGTGKSDGDMELFSPQEYTDHYDAVEWAGTQAWSNGKVGLLGISYYAIGQWAVAAMHPPHLAAIVVWEGASDIYREFFYHGGILSNNFLDAWWTRQVTGNQSALAEGAENPGTVVGDNVDLPAVVRKHPMWDDFWDARVPDLSQVDVPVLSAGNWAGYSLHLRGNIEGYLGAGSDQKWLELHTGTHFGPFYTEESREYQKSFLDRFVAGDETAWTDQPPVRVQVRTATDTFIRAEQEWPLARTRWTAFGLDAATNGLVADPEGAEPSSLDADSVTYDAPDGSVTFLTPPLPEDTEITGPLALHVWVESSADDTDLFVTLIDIGPDGEEVVFEDASGTGNMGPVTKGWLRVSQRELDDDASTAYRPVLQHRRRLPLEPGEPVLAHVEIIPTSLVFGKGHRIGVVIGAGDRPDPSRFLHNDPNDRAGSVSGTVTLHTGGDQPSHLLLPVIP